ncbi:MAG: UDP-glucose 4-epimerase GalE [Bacteroidia bacterium]|nr:UDP-glucose 4-epimerase GalE [Bacteroidia bacterium]NNF29836.1 UDP-glucose 4-epimerase GalE [Flavobacteriaceae bacterium]MBT8275964.1 UDP-glucose 4-epimerase GalE [Bacteroidia bacterium]NNJ82990.1 UDP-glucose 4-epimerase GalE [Flavobacteriaceae bacterium]NNK53804.1 UDP-glucose 4-epimerase GalE [Flavobacteriaceae bacterium]
MKRILVTGGLGYIGSHTVVELQAAGYKVVIIDNLSNSTMDVLDGIAAISSERPDTEILDLRDKEKVHTFFNDYNNIEGIIHFAASKAVGESVENPLLYYENNVGSLVYLLKECRDRGIENFIFSSSCTVYGQPDTLPITEDAPVKPAISPYGNTKQISEEIIRDLSHASNLRAISLRYFNPIGAHGSAEIGELPKGVPQNLVPYITQTAAGIREELSVFGNDYPTPDGSCIRDYIHIVDLAKAHVIALQRLISKENTDDFEIFNVGTGKGSSVLEVIHAFEEVTGNKLNYKIVDRRPGDVISVYADTGKANRVLGWKAEKTMEEALASAWAWEKKVRGIQ